MSAAAPYRHFADKSALVGALVLGGFDELNATFEGADDLASMFRVYATFARAKPRLLGLMFGSVYREDGEDFEFTRRSNTALSHLLRVVMPLLPAGAGYKERYSAALAAWSMIHGYSLLSAEQGLAGLFENVLADPGELVGRLELA